MSAIPVCGLILLHFVLGSIIIRVTTRLVAGVTPTLGRTIAAMIASFVVTFFVGFCVALLSKPPTLSQIAVSAIYLTAQTVVYAVVLAGQNGSGISFGQAFVIVLLQIPVAIVLAIAVVAVLAGAGYTVGSFLPNQHHASAPMRQSSAQVRPARLRVPVSFTTAYGNVVMPVGSAVQILEETPKGYRARAAGNEVLLMKDQFTFDSK